MLFMYCSPYGEQRAFGATHLTHVPPSSYSSASSCFEPLSSPPLKRRSLATSSSATPRSSLWPRTPFHAAIQFDPLFFPDLRFKLPRSLQKILPAHGGHYILILLRLRMNRYPRDLWKFFLHTVLQRARHVMHLRDRQLAAHHAMARSQNVMGYLPHYHIVAVQKFVILRRQPVQKRFNRARQVAQILRAGIRDADCHAQRLNMNVYLHRLSPQLPDFFFQVGCLLVRLLQSQVRIKFQ